MGRRMKGSRRSLRGTRVALALAFAALALTAPELSRLALRSRCGSRRWLRRGRLVRGVWVSRPAGVWLGSASERGFTAFGSSERVTATRVPSCRRANPVVMTISASATPLSTTASVSVCCAMATGRTVTLSSAPTT